ncbi:MAG: PAS domain-containing sensor histidine kinase [Bacteroidota bacterium]
MNNSESSIKEEVPFAQKDLFNLVIESLPDQIYLKDINSRFIRCNTPVAVSAGFKSSEELIGKTDFDCHPGEAEQFFNDEQTLMKLDQSLINHEEHFVDNKTGEIKWNLSTKVPVKDDLGKVVGLLGINRDITAIKTAVLEREEMMKKLVERNNDLEHLTAELSEKSKILNEQAVALQQLNQELTRQKDQELEKAIAQGKFEIASEVLHDIGNALVGFGSYLGKINRVIAKNSVAAIKNLNLFIKDQHNAIAGGIGAAKADALVVVTEGIGKTQAENNEEIATATTELLHIVTHIQEILNIQRQFVSGHEGAQDRKLVNLANIIEDCKSMLLASFNKQDIALQIKIQPGIPTIKGDPTKLMQVLLNVLKNSMEAIDHATEGKYIDVTMSSVNNEINLTIADNGSGFDEATSKRFFTRGFTTKKSGTGLGLYNCKSIIESHGGSFQILSDGVGLGATTSITFAQN